jgi:hypothetical protein
MKKLGLGLFLLLLVSCGGTKQKHHHHKTDCTLTVYSETGDPIKSWKCKESEVIYQGNGIKFVDTLDNTVCIRTFSGTVIIEKDEE